MLSTNATSVRTRQSPASSPRNSPCPSPHGSPRFTRKSGSYRRNRKSVIPVLVVHGSSWGMSDCVADLCLEGIKQATNRGYEVLTGPEGTATQAVQSAVQYLETDPAFFQGMIGPLYRDIRMDAMIMEGRKLRAGCIVGVPNICHPIKLANSLMEKNSQFTLVGEAAEQFAKESGSVEFSDPRIVLDNCNRLDKQQYRDLIECSLSKTARSVGAVAVDYQGRVACAWSSKTADCGDGVVMPLANVGSAAFCDDYVGAVSCVGAFGADAISRTCLARHITGLMQQSGMSAKEAVIAGLEYMHNRIHGACAGAIAVSNSGDVGVHFTTDKMAWAYRRGEQMKYGLNPKQCLSEDNSEDFTF